MVTLGLLSATFLVSSPVVEDKEWFSILLQLYCQETSKKCVLRDFVLFCLSLFFPFSCSWLKHAKPELCWLPFLRLHVVLGTIKLMNPPRREGTGSVCKTAAHRPFSFDEGDAAFWGSWAPPPGSEGCPSALGLPLLGRCVGWVSSVRGLFFQK